MGKLIRIGTGNGHNEKSLVNFVADQDCTAYGLQEANTLLHDFRTLGEYNTFCAGDDRARGEVPILVRHNKKILGKSYHKVSDAIPGLERVAPDRWSTQVRFEHAVATEAGYKGIALINWHPDAGPKQLHGTNPNAAIVREYSLAAASVKNDIRSARIAKYLPIVTGDLQMTYKDRQTWAPYYLYASLKMQTVTDNIDWIAWDPNLRLVASHTVPLFDHNGIVATFKAN